MINDNSKIGDFAKVISGFAFKSKDFVEDGIPVLKIANIKHEHVVFDPVQYLPPEFLTVDTKFHVQNGDVMICLTGSHISQPNSVVGRVAKYRHHRQALLNQRAGRIVVTEPKKLDREFLYYFLRQEKIMHGLALNAGGAANQANISPKDVEGVALPKIEIVEQKRIADILSTYDDLIENNRRRIKLLDKSARQLYKEWFVRFRFPGHEHVKIIAGIPEGWCARPLVEIAEITMGQSPKSEFYNDIGDGLPFHQGVTGYGTRFVEHSVYCSKVTRIAEKGDILFSVRAPVGRLNVTEDKIILGRGLSSMRARDGNQSFLFYHLKNYFFKEDMMGGGAIYASVTKKDVETLETVMPTDNLIEAYQEFAESIDLQISILSAEIKNLASARELILPKLMSGEIAV